MSIAFVGGNKGNLTSTNTTLSVSYTCAANHCIIICVYVNSTTAVNTVADNASGGSAVYTLIGAINNASPGIRTEMWATGAAGSKVATSFTVTPASTAIYGFTVCEYSGVVALGKNTTLTSSSGNPTISLSTQDNNNYVAAGFNTAGNNAQVASTGTQRELLGLFPGSGTRIEGGHYDNTASTPSSVSIVVGDVSGEPSAMVALELRTALGSTDPPFWSIGQPTLHYSPTIVTI